MIFLEVEFNTEEIEIIIEHMGLSYNKLETEILKTHREQLQEIWDDHPVVYSNVDEEIKLKSSEPIPDPEFYSVGEEGDIL